MTQIPDPQIDWSRPVVPVPNEAKLLAAYLGYPFEVPLERHVTDARRHWIRGDTEEDLGPWQFEIIGIPIQALPEAPDEPPDVFAYGYRQSDDGPLLWVRMIVIRCLRPMSGVFVERTYRVNGTYREDICAVNTCERDGITFVRMMRDAEKALAVLGAVFPQNEPGRPLATGYVATLEAFRARIFPIIRKLATEGMTRPRQEQVCEVITTSWPEYQTGRPIQDRICRPRQLRRWFTELGWASWTAVVDEALDAN
jgi:hypothetical protein